MPEIGALSWAVFVMASSLLLLGFLFFTGGRGKLEDRLDELRGGAPPAPDGLAQLARATLPKMGTMMMPKNEDERTRLQSRLLHAGLYKPQAMPVFLGVKMLLMIGPPLIAMALGAAGVISQKGILLGCFAGAFGMVGPTFWLDSRKASRQTNFRRALPDAMDVLVICLEGGGSLPAALRRVATELRTAHPELAMELNIVQREVQMGRSVGEAIRQFADRTDLEEVRGLASVILQSERFGASLVKALRVHAETLRQKRLQRAEEMAQKAIIKILFPTILFIMPAMFLVILGPTTVRLMEIMKGLN